jgi:hypothetical protein
MLCSRTIEYGNTTRGLAIVTAGQPVVRCRAVAPLRVGLGHLSFSFNSGGLLDSAKMRENAGSQSAQGCK